jgi:4-hydroxy-tetrahydrodipicolinate reductase
MQETIMLKIGILGSTGRVGKLLIDEMEGKDWPDLSYIGGLHSASTQEETTALFEKADMLIDFSAPTATEQNIITATHHRKPMIIGTTGLSHEQENEITFASKEIPLIYAANTSIGVTLLQGLVEQAAKALDVSYDIEILETHHKHKVDAPSGTALALGKAAAKGRGIDAPSGDTNRSGARVDGTIGYAVRRGGDVPGEHSVTFYGAGERIELSHIASDRHLFAKGALRAAQWLHGKPAGLYTMKDVLGL